MVTTCLKVLGSTPLLVAVGAALLLMTVETDRLASFRHEAPVLRPAPSSVPSDADARVPAMAPPVQETSTRSAATRA